MYLNNDCVKLVWLLIVLFCDSNKVMETKSVMMIEADFKSFRLAHLPLFAPSTLS